MKRKLTSQSAFFSLRVLVGLFIALAGCLPSCLRRARYGASNWGRCRTGRVVAPSPDKNKVTTRSSIDPLVPAMFDCSKIHELGIDKQENFRAGAIMIHCGQATGGDPDQGAARYQCVFQACARLSRTLAYGTTDVDRLLALRPRPTLRSPKHSPRGTRITRSRSSLPTTTYAAAISARSISPAHRSPTTAATPSRDSPRQTVKVPSTIRWATRLFCITVQPALVHSLAGRRVRWPGLGRI